MAIAKLFLLLLVTIGQSYVMSPPNVRPPASQLRELRGFVEYTAPYLALFIKVLGLTWFFLEGSVLFALSGYCPSILAQPILHFLVPGSATPATLIAFTLFTPTYICGTLLALSGTLLRGYCFHTLGPRFTFELAIRPSHKLVTDGIYSVVRHPSYTGALGSTAGMFLCVFDQQSVCAAWVRTIIGGNASGDTSGTVVSACVVTTALALLVMWLDKRIDNEERMLEKNFGDEWRMWAKRVPHRLIPGVY